MGETYAILDFPAAPVTDRAGVSGGRLVFDEPVGIIAAHRLDEVRPALRLVEQAARAGAWAVGFVAYEAAPAFDRALEVRPHSGTTPLVWFALFRDGPAPRGAARPQRAAPVAAPLHWQHDTDRAAYDHAIREIRDGIAAGDVYQVNFTLRLGASCPPDCAAAVYETLVAGGHGLFHALIETPGWSIVSASPELFIDCAAGVLTTRPMKGTHRRGRVLDEDRAAADRLAASTKDRAENLMIVDLLRNDLGRIAAFGSVRVPAMFEIETYPTVHQLTSTVTARLRDGLGLDDVFAAMFPCGSVTGAPKVTAMKAIAELEHAPRGPYCGAIGVVRPDGSFTFNVAIRTMLLDRAAGTATYGTGGGITWDSRVDDEYDELTAKAALLGGLQPPFRLIETLRLDNGVYARLDRHLSRLADSARYWQFSGDVAAAAACALEHERSTAPAGAWRVRLTAGRDGDVEVARTRLDSHAHYDIGDPVMARNDVRLADSPVSRSDRLLFHKTTARAGLDQRRAAHPDVFDVLLWNEQGEVTEFTRGNVVALMDGVLVTPPREAGLLAGTFRAELLDEGRIHEAVITLDSVRSASRIWFINSVRGWVSVRLIGQNEPANTEQGPVADPALPVGDRSV